jgi:hypothetical protein
MSLLSTTKTLLRLLPLVLLFVSCGDKTPDKSSAYITTVYQYVYAPGQHAALVKKTDISNFIGEPTTDKSFLYLGGFGGYVVAGFDHNVTNGDGLDFEVFALKGASPEPGIVYVMSDTNGDGLPNDAWYELKGNQFPNSKRHYWVRYYKAVADNSNITWKDSEGSKGELKSGYGSAYSATWWWPATTTDSITLYGTRLPDSYINTSSTSAQNWVVPSTLFTWGYAKNLTGTDYDTDLGANKFDIANAVDSLGSSVNLPHIRFIKIQTSVFQQAGWLNEVSTEVRGAKDLRK